MLLCTGPGQYTDTPMPSGASSMCSASDNAITAALVIEYSPAATGSRPPIDDVVTMYPPSPWARMRGRNAWMPCATPLMLTSMSQSQSPSVASATGPASPMPALLTSTCTRPKRRSVSSAARSTAARSVTSSVTASTPSPSSANCASDSSMCSCRRPLITTCMPARANATAMPRPMPLDPPVMKATLPSTSSIVSPALRARALRARSRERLREGRRGVRADLVGADPRGAFDQAQRAVHDVEHREVGVDAGDAALAGQREGALRDDLRPALAVHVLHRHPHLRRPGHQVHGAADRRVAAGHVPVGEVAVGRHLQRSEHRDVQVPAADHRERHRGVGDRRPADQRDRLLSGVGQVRVAVAVRRRPHAEDAVLGVQHHLDPVRDEPGDVEGDADAEVDDEAVLEVGREALGDLLAGAPAHLWGSGLGHRGALPVIALSVICRVMVWWAASSSTTPACRSATDPGATTTSST